jgi:xanthine dehydrogenase molybdenum-binding subunit
VSKEQFQYVGKSISPRELFDKVTGKFQYVGDMPVELYGKILRSPHPHARIKHIDISRVEKLGGVEAVLTHRDVPPRKLPRRDQRACYILEDHVRFVGDEVAAVAARTRAIAEEALDLFKVEYDILPAVFDPEEAAKPEAPQLYPGGNVYGPQFGMMVEKGLNEPVIMEWGDIEEGFQEADEIIEDKVEVKPQIHSPIEPHICIASWKRDELTLWTATQSPYEVRMSIAHALGMPEGKVRVIYGAIGGGFGSKYIERYQPIAALLSKKAGGKSTKIVLTREEELCHAGRAGAKIRVKLGVKKDGTITAISLKGFFNLGGYGNIIGGCGRFGEESPCLAYKYQNARFEGWDVHTNHITSQPCRGVALPTLTFAMENVIDQAAERLNMDPVQFRLRNLPETDTLMPLKPHKNPIYPRAELDAYPAQQVLRDVAEKIDWERFKGYRQPVAVEGPKSKGLGIAASQGWGGFCTGGFINETVILNNDGSVHILSGHTDLGTGSNTTLRQIAAEALGVPIEDVTMTTGDTTIGHFDMIGARGSRSMTTAGHLILVAIEEGKNKIRQMAAPLLEVKAEEIEVREKKAYVKGDEERAILLRELLTSTVKCTVGGDPKDWLLIKGTMWPLVVPGKKTRNPIAAASEVEVDLETGEVKPVRVITGNSPGRMINPTIVRGQYTGTAAMVLGMALWEEFKYDGENSVYEHAALTDYKVPRALDVPPIENVIIEEFVERPLDEGGPYGARGVGELAGLGIVASVANAIHNATGARLRQTPMTAEKVLEAMHREREKKR